MIENTYWNSNGKHQAIADQLRKLVPGSGPADTPHGDLLRCVTNLYYDFYNNGGGNIVYGSYNDQVRRVESFSDLFSIQGLERIDTFRKTIQYGEGFLITEEDLELLMDETILIVDRLHKQTPATQV